MDVAIGTLLGSYRLDRLVGKGSMGAVYVAEDVHLRRRVALKVLNPELADDERFRRRFLLESQLAASLEHPHIVPIYAAGEQDGSLFLAMRLIEGVDLRGLLKERHHLEPRRVLALLGQVAEALDAAHAIGLVHRDVKPANILVTPGPPEHAYLCDFGLAKHASSVDSLTGERSFVGTISYIAPEQIEGGPVDARADQYALACVLYECLTGVKPYEREGELQTLFAHLREDAPRLTDVEPSLGVAVDAVVSRALDKDPNARYETCTAMLEAAAGALGLEVAHRDAPAAQVVPRTFLIADIRGYTAFTSEHGDEAAGILTAGFEQVMREVTAEHEGRVLEIRGDEALAVFASARSALRAALAAQARFAQEPPARGVGIGIDTGEAAPTGEGYRGSALNTAARLCSLAGPGETLVSDTTTRVAGAADGIAYGKAREERVKGIPEPVRFSPIASPGVLPPDQVRGGGRRRRHVSRRAGVAMIAGGLLALAAAAVGALTLSGGSDALSVPPHALAVFDADSGKVKWSLPFETDPDYAIVKGRTAYVNLPDEGNVAAVDLDTHVVKSRIRLPEGQNMGPIIGTTMWTGGSGDRVIPLDLRYGSAGKAVKLDRSGDYEADDPWIAAGGGSLWIAYGKPPRVARVDPATRKVTATILLDKTRRDFWCCGLIAYGDGQVWVADRGSGDLWRIDPRTNAIVSTGTLRGPWLEDLVAGGGYAWVPRTDDAGVWQLDSTLARNRLVPTGVWPWAASYGGGRAWSSNRNDGTVSAIDPLTGTTKTIDVGGAPVSAAASGKELVVALAERQPDPYTGLKGDVATVFASGDPIETPDPAQGSPDYVERNQIHDAIDLRLVRNDDSDGDGVQELVGDGADLPTVSDGGRTWRFAVRKGYRFSPPSGAPVTAQVFRASIERALSPDWGKFPPFPNYLEDVVGVAAYRAGKADHITGLEVDGDTLIFRLTRPLRDLGARLALQPYAAVLPGTPVVKGGIREPLPSAGPYYLASHADNASAVIKRNPNYTGPRTPGFDAFVWRMLVANDPAIALVEKGEGDVVVEYVDQNTGAKSPLLAAGGPLQRSYGAGKSPRYSRTGTPFTWFIRFNAVRGPFRDLDLRRAVSLAVDRTELAPFWDGTPADLFMPPGLASHRPQGTVYPLTAQVARARRLARRAAGTTVTLAADPRESQQGMAKAIQRQLARIGLRVRIVTDWDRRQNASRYDLVLDTWLFDFVDPSMSFGPLLDPVHAGYDQYPVVDPPIFTDPRWISRIREVEKLAGKRRDAAYARLDRDLARGPVPLAALGHGQLGWFFSDRVACAHGIGINGSIDLAALCKR